MKYNREQRIRLLKDAVDALSCEPPLPREQAERIAKQRIRSVIAELEEEQHG